MELKTEYQYEFEGFYDRASPIIHRDLSPNNILLSYDSVAKISDLGVARVVKAGTKNTKSKLTKAPGTMDFMPPEALVHVTIPCIPLAWTFFLQWINSAHS